MDKIAARKVLEVVSQCSIELSALVPYLKENCTDMAEYEMYGKNIAKVIAYIYQDIKSPIFETYPELRREIEDKLSSQEKE